MRIERIKRPCDFQDLLRKMVCLWLGCFFPLVLAAQILPPEIRDKTLYKFEIFEEGIYEINHATLKQIGLNANKVNLDHIHIYGSWEKQATFFANKNEFLTALPITVVRSQEGISSSTDKILFYAAGPHKLGIDAHNKAYTFKKNPYSESTYVYLVYNENRESKKVATKKNITESTTATSNTVQTFLHHELNERNLINSGNIWLGERIADTSCETLDFTLPHAVSGHSKALFSVASQARQEANLKVTTNSFQDTIQFSPLAAGTYSPRALLAKKYLDIPITDENMQLEMCFEQSGGAVAYLDYITFTFSQKLTWQETPMLFCNFESKDKTEVTFMIDDSQETLRLWDIGQLENPVEHVLTHQEKSSYFSYNPEGQIRRFALFDPSQTQLTPHYVGEKKLNAIFETTPVDLLIITHPFLREAADRLAAFRQQEDGLAVKVVNVDEVYDAFGNGAPTPFAIQKYISWFYHETTDNRLKYILLFGDSSYDYLNHLSLENATKAIIPSFQTNESFDPLASYVTDDLYGMLTLPASENELADAVMQLGVARIPATNLTEAQAVVSKLLQYTNNVGDWQQDILFVADDGDFNVHQSQADRLANIIEEHLPYLNPKRLFIDAFPQEKQGNTTFASAAKERLNASIDRGVAIINYTGHGSENGWTAERLLRKGDVKNWRNSAKYPVLFTATCEFGAYDNPQLQSGGEEVLLQTAKGAIAVLSATRPAISGSNFEINRNFYEILKDTPNMKLGDLLRETKNAVATSAVKRHFTLLGDPSMPLSIPQPKIYIDSISSFKDENEVWQLYLKGQVDTKTQADFSEKALLEIYAPPVPFNTYGEEQEEWKATYYNQNEYLKRGNINTVDGHFSVTTSIPQWQNLELQDIKVSIYADEEATGKSYAQAITDFPSIEPAVTASTDIDPPEIKLSIADKVEGNNSLNQLGYLVAEISDESDILLNTFTTAYQLIATIDYDTSNIYFLGDYFYTALENPTKSYIQFPLENFKLPSGNYTVTLSASDIWQNKGTASISFDYNDDEIFQITEVAVFPNPVVEDLNIYISVNTPAESVVYQLVFYDINGQRLLEQTGDLIEGENTLTINNRLFAVNKSQLILGLITLSKYTTGEDLLHTFKLMVNK